MNAVRILMLFPILILFAAVELADALGNFGYHVGEIWQDEDWPSQVASIAIWLSLACGVWWLL